MKNDSTKKVRVRTEVQNIPYRDPLQGYLALRHLLGMDQVYIVESLSGPLDDARLAIVGFGPILTIRAKADWVQLEGHDGLMKRLAMRAINAGVLMERSPGQYSLVYRKALWDLLRTAEGLFSISPPDPGKAFNFGFFGYFGYDVAWAIEDLPTMIPDTNSIPDVILNIYQGVVEFDRINEKSRLIVNYSDEWDAPSKDLLKSTLACITLYNDAPTISVTPYSKSVHATVTMDHYLQKVRKVLHHISIGDIYQLQLGHEVEIESQVPPLSVYRRLRTSNPSPYMYLIPFGEFIMIGASPELYIRVEKKLITMRPIAGTAKRGHNPQEDAAIVQALKGDQKERAEHVMLVDLCRNDIGRVCAPGTLKEKDLMVVEQYSHVSHLVSTITGEQDSIVDIYDTIAATFPAGTMTGAPKIRAMEIIERLETSRRGAYAGAVGFIDFSGYANMALCIRSAINIGDRYFIRASAGIVADSIAETEWNETLYKMGALYWAITNEEIIDARIGH
jgi:anthranilate/para-aminobenzoate synthase component I